MSTWVQALLTILVSALSGITINFSFRRGERRLVERRDRAKGTPGQMQATVLNGYAPILQKALDRIERYQEENERLRTRLAEYEERNRSEIRSSAPRRRRITTSPARRTTK